MRAGVYAVACPQEHRAHLYTHTNEYIYSDIYIYTHENLVEHRILLCIYKCLDIYIYIHIKLSTQLFAIYIADLVVHSVKTPIQIYICVS